MGPSSAFGGAFGKMPGPAQQGPNPATQFPGNGALPGPAQNGRNPQGPANPTPPLAPAPGTGNTLGPQAIRASGPSQGFDSSYLQNLATAIGGLFSNNKQGGNVMKVNPLGNLSEISGPSGQEGNAPQAGLPMTWLQQALNGLGFNFAPQAASTVPTAPTVGSLGGGNGGGGRGLRMAQ